MSEVSIGTLIAIAIIGGGLGAMAPYFFLSLICFVLVGLLWGLIITKPFYEAWVDKRYNDQLNRAVLKQRDEVINLPLSDHGGH